MLVNNLTSYFQHACFPYGGMNACFGKESDIERILSGKKPLDYSRGELFEFSVANAPFSFEELSSVLFESEGNVLVLNDGNNASSCALRPEDDLETCLKILGTLGHQAIYKSVPLENAIARTKSGEILSSNHWRSSSFSNPYGPNERKNVSTMNAKVRTSFIVKAMRDAHFITVVDYAAKSLDKKVLDAVGKFVENKFALANLLFPLDAGVSAEFNAAIISALSPRCNNYENEDIVGNRRSLGLLYDDTKNVALIPYVHEENIVFVGGHPIRKNAALETLENIASSSTEAEANYQAMLTGLSITGFPKDNSRLSNVISAVCQLEMTGHFLNEREIALELQKRSWFIKHENDVRSLKDARRKRKNRSPLPWTAWQQHGGREAKTEGGAISSCGLLEEVSHQPDSPMDVLRWKCNDTCFYQGKTFSSQFCTFEKTLTEEKSAFLAFAYALFAGTMSNDYVNTMELEYGGTGPSLDSYEWYFTRDGVLYFKRIKRKNNEATRRRRRIGRNLRSLQKSRASRTKTPCFLDDIDMEEGEESENEYAKGCADKRTTADDNDNVFVENNKEYEERDNGCGKNDDGDDDDRNESDLNYILKGRGKYDPYALRKYDGKGLFPVVAKSGELLSKIKEGQVLFDSDRFVSSRDDGHEKDGGVGFFKLYDCFGPSVYENARGLDPKLGEAIDFSSFYVQYVNVQDDLFPNDDLRENCMNDTYYYYDDDNDNDYRGNTSNDKFKNELPKKKKAIVSKTAHLRKIDHSFVGNKVLRTLIPKEAELLKNGTYHEANPLWMQCCMYVCSREFKTRTICLTYDNVPKTIEDVHFLLRYHRMRCEPTFSMCLGYHNPKTNSFSYSIFECVPEIVRGTDFPNKCDAYEISFVDFCGPSTSGTGVNDERHLEITRTPVPKKTMKNVLKASVMLVINSGF